MGIFFYRKEAEYIFNSLFKLSKNDKTCESLSNLIFSSKLDRNSRRAKKITVKYNNNEKNFDITTSKNNRGYAIIAKNYRNIFEIFESDIPNILHSKTPKLQYLIIEKLSEDHARASTFSPFISGCIENRKTNYTGYYFKLELKNRTPFKNINPSGNENEYFLISQVNKDDCDKIVLLETPPLSTTSNKNVK